MSHRRRWGLFVFVLASASLWFASKLVLFRGLSYFGDLFPTIQAAYNATAHGLFYFDNAYGWTGTLHNYFTLFALGPAAWTFGASGVFSATILLNVFASWRIVRAEEYSGRDHWLILASLWGPVGFYLFDDPVDGWHHETLLFPAGLLFGFFLARSNRLAAALTGALIVLTREDGIVLVCLIGVSSLFLRGDTRWSAARFAKLVGIIASSLLIFFAGLAYLHHLQLGLSPPNDRLGMALSGVGNVFFNPDYLNRFLRDSASATVLGLIPILFLSGKGRYRASAVYFLASIPLSMMFAVANAKYGNDPMYTALWPPRLAYYAGLGAAVFSLGSASMGGGLLLESGSVVKPSPCRKGTVLAVLLLFLFQTISLQRFRGYSYLERSFAAWGAEPDLPILKFSPNEVEYLRAFAQSLPKMEPILVDPQLFAFFHTQAVVWPQLSGRYFQTPRYVICDERGRRHWRAGAWCMAELKKLAPLGRLFSFEGIHILKVERLSEVPTDFNSPLRLIPR